MADSSVSGGTDRAGHPLTSNHPNTTPRKQTVTYQPRSRHTSADGFSLLFSEAAAAQHAPIDTFDKPTAEQKRAIQQRSEPNGDHHLTFVDLADSARAGQ